MQCLLLEILSLKNIVNRAYSGKQTNKTTQKKKVVKGPRELVIIRYEGSADLASCCPGV